MTVTCALQISTRVLLERVMAMRPYPWGVVVTFHELLQSETYNLLGQKFITSDEAIEKVFRLFVARHA